MLMRSRANFSTLAPTSVPVHPGAVGTDLDERKAFLLRLETVMQELGWTSAEWCKRAEVADSLIPNFRYRVERGMSAGMSVPTIAALSRVAGISFEWLATGSGEMRPKPWDPGRQAAIAAAMLLEYEREVIEALEAEPSPSEGGNTEYWVRRAQALQAKALSGLC